MGFGRGVPDHGPSLGRHGSHQGILGAGNAGLVEKELPAFELVGLDLVAVAHGERGPQLLQGEEMSVHPPPSDHVPAGRWQRHPAESGQEWAGEENRGAYPSTELGIQRLGGDGVRIDVDGVGTGPIDCRAQMGQQLQHGLDVPDSGDVFEGDGALGQKRGGQEGKRGVLVPRRPNRALKPMTALHLETRRHGQTSPGS